MSKLSNEQIEWIIKAKVHGKLTNKEIADVQGIYQLADCNNSIDSTKVQSWRHKRPFLERNKNEIVEL